MGQRANALFLGVVATILIGCAGGSTDPRTGGFFVDWDAIEKKQEELRKKLEGIEKDKQSQLSEKDWREKDKAVVLDEKRAVEQELHKLSTSISSLERSVKAKQARTAAQRKEQERLLGELGKLRGSAKANSDNVANPEDSRLVLERLHKRRQELEKEADNLMKL